MPDTKILVTCPPCMICGERSQIEVPAAALHRWQSGTLVQNAFPDLSLDERELLQTGTHPDCWEIMWEEGGE